MRGEITGKEQSLGRRWVLGWALKRKWNSKKVSQAEEWPLYRRVNVSKTQREHIPPGKVEGVEQSEYEAGI